MIAKMRTIGQLSHRSGGLMMIQLECPNCFAVAKLSKGNTTCKCGHEFHISDPSVFDRARPPTLNDQMLVTTETTLDGYAGGGSATLQDELMTMRRSCLDDLRRQASSVGANAVIAIDFQYANLSGKDKFMMLVAATGAAVVIEKTGESMSEKYREIR